MSFKGSLLNGVHRERRQPSFRMKHGLLEKKKDYVLRAKDFQVKRRKLQKMRRKGEFKNPEEFYYKMNRMRTKDGIVLSAKKPHTQNELLAMRKQDLSYLQSKLTSESKMLDKIQGLTTKVLTDDRIESATPKRFVFDSNGHAIPAQLDEKIEVEDDRITHIDEISEHDPVRDNAILRQLAQRKKRAEKMAKMIEKIDTQVQLMGKGQRRRIAREEIKDKRKEKRTLEEVILDDTAATESTRGANGAIFKWKRERKK